MSNIMDGNRTTKILALFDFDGTITTKDSLAEFIKFAVGNKTYYMGLLRLSMILISYTLKILPNDKAKEKLISHFFSGWDINKFQKIARQYSSKKIGKIVRNKAIQKIKWHQRKGHKVVVVSASIECWLKVWCSNNNIELISTKLEIKDSVLTGKFSSKNCYGIEKVNRIKEKYDLDDYSYIYAYGDSNGDKELLSLANESFYKPFRDS